MAVKQFSSDSSKDVWDAFYKIYYGNKESVWGFWDNVEFENLMGNENDQYASVEYNGIKGEVHGEVDFNFKSDENPRAWQKRKYNYYWGILDKDKKMSPSEKKDAKNLLKECKNKMYDPNNLSLIFRTGGLNNVKGLLSQDSRALDRFDVFIYVLNDFLSIEKDKRSSMHLILSYAWKNCVDNRANLMEYLKEFDGILDYFTKALLIEETDESKDFINRLIISGSKPIDDGKRVVEYLNLAKEYWGLRQCLVDKVFENKE